MVDTASGLGTAAQGKPPGSVSKAAAAPPPTEEKEEPKEQVSATK